MVRLPATRQWQEAGCGSSGCGDSDRHVKGQSFWLGSNVRIANGRWPMDNGRTTASHQCTGAQRGHIWCTVVRQGPDTGPHYHPDRQRSPSCVHQQDGREQLSSIMQPGARPVELVHPTPAYSGCRVPPRCIEHSGGLPFTASCRQQRLALASKSLSGHSAELRGTLYVRPVRFQNEPSTPPVRELVPRSGGHSS